jgi:N-methylhydantoinase B
VIREYEVLVDEAVVGVRHDSVKVPPNGVRGGLAGRPGYVLVKRARGGEQRLPSMSDGNVLRRGDRLRVVTTGGGGWGSPLDRRPAVVLNDVLNGFVSMESAERDYGVVIDPVRREIDINETERLRAELRKRPGSDRERGDAYG